eukprot:CAMPEP_0172635020 /NCGR_PEP_ID=MMETSP1068-20121228/197186_1 /TAXON_ID=35684 /ORGANISM="Pseudopedinella elastica, Strain CCMP716" /LENGTH=466 /DNA_ID=CAMNT_0013447097 /DNA_START=121 /DNA_END=1517 /DNA_ORIENTATION=-
MSPLSGLARHFDDDNDETRERNINTYKSMYPADRNKNEGSAVEDAELKVTRLLEHVEKLFENLADQKKEFGLMKAGFEEELEAQERVWTHEAGTNGTADPRVRRCHERLGLLRKSLVSQRNIAELELTLAKERARQKSLSSEAARNTTDQSRQATINRLSLELNNAKRAVINSHAGSKKLRQGDAKSDQDFEAEGKEAKAEEAEQTAHLHALEAEVNKLRARVAETQASESDESGSPSSGEGGVPVHDSYAAEKPWIDEVRAFALLLLPILIASLAATCSRPAPSSPHSPVGGARLWTVSRCPGSDCFAGSAHHLAFFLLFLPRLLATCALALAFASLALGAEPLLLGHKGPGPLALPPAQEGPLAAPLSMLRWLGGGGTGWSLSAALRSDLTLMFGSYATLLLAASCGCFDTPGGGAYHGRAHERLRRALQLVLVLAVAVARAARDLNWTGSKALTEMSALEKRG